MRRKITAWVANDVGFLGKPHPRLYVMFLGEKKPHLTKGGYFLQGSDKGSRWPVKAKPFGKIRAGECVKVSITIHYDKGA